MLLMRGIFATAAPASEPKFAEMENGLFETFSRSPSVRLCLFLMAAVNCKKRDAANQCLCQLWVGRFLWSCGFGCRSLGLAFFPAAPAEKR